MTLIQNQGAVKRKRVVEDPSTRLPPTLWQGDQEVLATKDCNGVEVTSHLKPAVDASGRPRKNSCRHLVTMNCAGQEVRALKAYVLLVRPEPLIVTKTLKEEIEE